MSEALTRAALGSAARLAAEGSYVAAGRLLDTCDSAVHTLDVLLLRAKMAAQQGRYREAIDHWQEVLQMQPDHAEAGRGIALAKRLEGLKGNLFYLRANLIYALLLAAIAGLAVALVSTASCRGGRPEVASLRALAKEQGRQLETARGMVAALQGTAAREGREVPAGLRLDVPGAALRREGDEQVLSFAEGLFRRGTELRPGARTALASLARQLEPWAGRVSVGVVGHTDEAAVPAGAAYRDNAALALARAAAVVSHMRASASLPAGMFTVRGLGEIGAPYPNDNAANRARNRTAVIRIGGVEKPGRSGP